MSRPSLPLLILLAGLGVVPGCASPSVPARAPKITRIAFGSCAFQWKPQPIWKAVVAVEPDLYLSLGDAIYGDFDGERAYEITAVSLRAEWQRLANHPDWQTLTQSVPVEGIWDNHDYGHHSAGAEFPLKEASQKLFLDFFDEPQDSERRRTPGIYKALRFGPPGRCVQVLLLDTRYFKDPPLKASRAAGATGSLGKYEAHNDPAASLLGEEQWRWLEARLAEPAEIRLVASSTQVIADQKGMDEWGNYPHERKRLFQLLRSTGAGGVLLLSGNVHFAELSRTDEGPYPLYDFTSSGLTHVNEDYAKVHNPRRVRGPLVRPNFGLLDIDWTSRPAPELRLSAVAEDGAVAFQETLSLDSLRP